MAESGAIVATSSVVTVFVTSSAVTVTLLGFSFEITNFPSQHSRKVSFYCIKTHIDILPYSTSLLHSLLNPRHLNPFSTIVPLSTSLQLVVTQQSQESNN